MEQFILGALLLAALSFAVLAAKGLLGLVLYVMMPPEHSDRLAKDDTTASL